MKNYWKTGTRVAGVLYVGLLAAASLLPSGSGSAGGWDRKVSPPVQNVLHVPAYAGLSMLAVSSTIPALRARMITLVLIGLACTIVGLLLELAQAGIPGRMGSASDVLWNSVGVAFGLAAVWAWRRWRAPAPSVGVGAAPGERPAR